MAPIRIASRRRQIDFHEKLRGAYLQLAAAEPQRCVIIDATAPKKMVAKHIWQTVSSRLKPAAARRSSGACGIVSCAGSRRREAPSPRTTDALLGHAATEAALLAAYRGGRVPHAFMLIGEKGIGKATLAYRMARFVLANPDPAAARVRAATSLALDPDHPVARRVAAQAHGDLLVLERTPNEKGVLRQQIAVEDVRRTVSFFGSTAGEGGWRVAIVDAVDELNRFGANALLKVLEEPPQRALLLLVCHSASRVLPTLRSRCSRHGDADLVGGRSGGRAGGGDRPLGDRSADVKAAAAAADGSVARALGFPRRGAL